MKEKEVVLAGRLMGKRIMGKSFAELKDAEGRIQVYVSRDDISTDEEKQCTMWFSKLLILAILLGFAVVLKRKWVKSRFMFMD
jgi:lysyl-tRNA synthetase class 2